MVIKHTVFKEDATGHAKPVDDSTPVTVGIRTVGLKLLHHGQHRPADHILPGRCLRILHEHHGSYQPISLNGTEGCVMPIETLKGIGISIDNLQSLGFLTLLSTLPGSPHITFTTALRLSVYPVTGHHLIRARHLII